MSSEELVNAYLDGGMSRRIFIKRLVAAGTSLGAAVSYAHLLAPDAKAASGRAGDGLAHYEPEILVGIRSERIRRVLNTRKLEVTVSTDDSAIFVLKAQIRHKGKLRTIGTRQVTFPAATADSVVRIPLSKRGRDVLATRDASVIRVACAATHHQALPQGAYTSRAVATKVLLG
jgi:hypothetical protein